MRKTLSVLIIFVFVNIVFSQEYEIISLGTFGGIESYAYGINDFGDVVGEVKYTDESPYSGGAFFWTPQQTTMLAQDAYRSAAYSINNNSEIVGYMESTSDSYRNAFYWNSQGGIQYFDMPENMRYSNSYEINNSGQMIVNARQYDDYWGLQHVVYTGDFSTGFNIIDFPTPLGGTALGISDAGHIVGSAYPNLDEFLTQRPYIYKDGQVTLLEDLGGPYSMVWSVNTSGYAVGYSIVSIDRPDIMIHAALWLDNNVYDLGTLGGVNSRAASINENGTIVGDAEIVNGTKHACLWQNRQIVDLNNYLPIDSEWDYLEAAYDINIHGQIVGVGLINGQEQAFLMTPVPEPTALFLFGIAGLFLRKK